MILDVRGAYGREYESAHQAFLDWEGGFDFKLVGVLGGPLGDKFVSVDCTRYLRKAGFTLIQFLGKDGQPVGHYSLVYGMEVNNVSGEVSGSRTA
jgi:hypothetical protein